MFDFEVEHIAGKLNIVADALSRLCEVDAGISVEEFNYYGEMISRALQEDELIDRCERAT